MKYSKLFESLIIRINETKALDTLNKIVVKQLIADVIEAELDKEIEVLKTETNKND
jgi:hypothetical protein